MSIPDELQHNLNLDRAFAALSQQSPSLIWRKHIADIETPVSAALKLIEPKRGDFLLESVEGGETRARYSFIGLAPDLVFRSIGAHAEINRNWANNRDDFTALELPSLAALRELADQCRMATPDALPKSLALLVGYFSFETIGQVEKLPAPKPSQLDLADMVFVRPSIIIVFDRLKDELFLIAPIWPDHKLQPLAMIEQANQRLDAIEARLDKMITASLRKPILQRDHPVAPQPRLAAEQFQSMVERAKDYIRAGDVFQVVLSQRFSCEFTLPPFELYRALRRINPSPFLYYLDLPNAALVGSSPEILVRVRDGQITIRPTAGTRPRGKDEAEDKANEQSLLADEKELAEHLMLLDLGRHDTGRMAEPSSVKVTDSFTIERYSHVMHIVSNVIGKLAANRDAIDALFAGFPAGTVSGAPKIRACEIINELEDEARGIYAGGVGYFAPDGSLDSCIVLRTAIVKDQQMHVQAGAGIVADSQADYEQRECEAKASALFAAAQMAIEMARSNAKSQQTAMASKEDMQ